MIYEEKIHVPSTTKVVKYELAQCVNCDSESINVNEYEDQYGYITTVKCNQCGKSIKENCPASSAINRWNKDNDIDSLIAHYTKGIETAKQSIAKLKKQATARKKAK